MGQNKYEGKYSLRYRNYIAGTTRAYFYPAYEGEDMVEKGRDKILLDNYASCDVKPDYVEIGLIDPTDEIIARFREKVIDSEAIKFVKGYMTIMGSAELD
jgi:hypothetical protein